MEQSIPASSGSRHTQYLRVFLMGVSGFVVNTTEFVPVALLSDIARDFSITPAETGWMLTLYAWIVALMSLPLMLLTARIERKRLLMGLFVVFIASHALSVVAWNFQILLFSRVGIALSHAIFWSITAAIALRVAPPGKKALALSVLATGTSLAMILGVPVGRVIGQWFGWRATFAVIGSIAFVVFILQAKLLPTMPSLFNGSLKKVPELLKNRFLVSLYAFCFVVFTAHYATYSYIEPFMQQVGNISPHSTTLILLLFGGAGILGSVIFSRWGDKSNTALMISTTVLIMLSMATLLLVLPSIWLVVVNIVVWGTALMVLMLSIQSRVIMIDANAQDVVMSMFSGIINLGIGSGALLGGFAATNIALSSVGYTGAAVACVAIALLTWMLKRFVELR